MTENDSAAEKRTAVDHLNFGAKTAKRVAWEAWEFTVEGPHLVRVTNASYGFEKADHSYLVGIKDRDGLLVPSECECKADLYSEEYACKHRVACATTAGPVVLQAAVDCPTPTGDTGKTTTQTLEDRLRADGGVMAGESTDNAGLIEADCKECDCAALSDGFPCWPCVRDGRQKLPEQ